MLQTLMCYSSGSNVSKQNLLFIKCKAPKAFDRINRILFPVSDRVGGRTLTVELKTENGTDNWDMGGQWVGRYVIVRYG